MNQVVEVVRRSSGQGGGSTNSRAADNYKQCFCEGFVLSYIAYCSNIDRKFEGWQKCPRYLQANVL